VADNLLSVLSNWVPRLIFFEVPYIKFHENPCSGSRDVTCGTAGRTW